MLKGFKEFILRGNAVEMAVGIVIGAAFGTVVDSVVQGLVNPLIGLILPGEVKDLAAKTFTVGGADFGWGLVVSSAITFVLTAAAIYFIIVMPMNALAERRAKGEDETDPTNEEKMVALLEEIARNSKS